jgi:hypothetical protein
MVADLSGFGDTLAKDLNLEIPMGGVECYRHRGQFVARLLWSLCRIVKRREGTGSQGSVQAIDIKQKELGVRAEAMAMRVPLHAHTTMLCNLQLTCQVENLGREGCL